jgi:hypothetical protein
MKTERRTDKQTDRRTNMKLIVAPLNFAKAPENGK